MCQSFAFGVTTSKKKPKSRKKTTAELVFEFAPYLRATPDGAASRNANKIADTFVLPRFTDKTFEGFIENEFLVAVPEKYGGYYLDNHSPRRFWFLAPEAFRYMNTLAKAYYQKFSRPVPQGQAFLKITSLARTEEYQTRLTRSNPNAAKNDTPERRSLHTTGYAFDISCKGLTQAKILWIAGYLKEGIERVQVLAIYEYKASHNFHVFVIPAPDPPQ
jgi:hypothetical protein